MQNAVGENKVYYMLDINNDIPMLVNAMEYFKKLYTMDDSIEIPQKKMLKESIDSIKTMIENKRRKLA